MFEKSLTESSQQPRGRKGVSTLAVSLFAHSATLLVLLALPLVYYQALPSTQLLTQLMAVPLPSVPPPPPPPTPQSRASHRQSTVTLVPPSTLQIPTEIPHGIPEPPEETPDFGVSYLSGEGPVGITGTAPAVALGPIQVAAREQAAPPPPPPVRRQPLRVSSLQSSKLIRRVEPVYPPLAVRARVEGVVLLQATINEIGEVSRLDVISGPPLLTQAAVDAVRQWRYSPTILSGEPISVITTITVNFQLHH